MHRLIARMRSGSPLLWWSGMVCIALTMLFGIMALIDPVTITGVRRWIKPAKFCISFVFFFWTLAWMLPALARSARMRSMIAASAVIVMAIELVAIAMQAARGVPSHFNNATLFDGMVYATMGVAIGTNTIVMLFLALFATFRWQPAFEEANNVRPSSGHVLVPIANVAERAGIVCGLWLVVIGSVFGILISVHGAHAIGVTEDAAGLPLAGWKRGGGDLRVAHFLGLHGFQASPIVAALTGSRVAVYGMSIVWAVSALLLYRSAMSGISIWPA